jgi:Ankyrin repeats (3 copies)
MMLQGVLSTSQDLKAAACSTSWRRKTGDELDPSSLLKLPVIECHLKYPAARSLPEGILYAPPSMNEKWVLAYKSGRILAARSWTGRVEAIADVHHTGTDLIVEHLRALPDSCLRISGRLMETFDWLIRVHALHQRLPLPVDDEAAAMLQKIPLSGFSPFGSALFCAAKHWSPPESKRKICSDGAILVNARLGEIAAIEKLVAEGADLEAPGNVGGYTALHLAIVQKEVKLFFALLDMGANVDALADRDMHALSLAIVHRAPLAVLEALAKRATAFLIPNTDGFNALHAAAEVDHGEVVPWLVSHGFDLEVRTRHGHTALHLACALGHESAARALLECGADVTAKSRDGETPEGIARQENRPQILKFLKNWKSAQT